jgi:hypothetical protein
MTNMEALAEEMPTHGQVLIEGSPRRQPDCTGLENITFGLEVTGIGFFGGFSPARWMRRSEFRSEVIGYLLQMGLSPVACSSVSPSRKLSSCGLGFC